MNAESFKEEPVRPEDLRWLSTHFKVKDQPDFSVDELFRGAPSLRLVKVPGQTAILREGELGRDLFVLYQGDVSINKKQGMFGSVEVARLAPGSLFGEIGFFERGIRKATVTAETPVKIFRIAAEDMQGLLAGRKGAAEELQAEMRDRIAQLRSVDDRG